MDTSPIREYLHAQLDALLADCDLVMDSYDYGTTFHDLDDFRFVAGKQVTQDVLQHKLQEHIEHNEKKEHQRCSRCQAQTRVKNQKKKAPLPPRTHDHSTPLSVILPTALPMNLTNDYNTLRTSKTIPNKRKDERSFMPTVLRFPFAMRTAKQNGER